MAVRPLASAPAALALALMLLLAGCVPEGSVAQPTPSPPAATPWAGKTRAPGPAPAVSPAGISATALGVELDVHASPDGVVVSTLTNPQASGAPLVLLVAATEGEWVQVHLAQRPNGSTGWVRASAVALQTLPYSLDVSTADNTLTLLEGGRPIETFPVSTGTGGTPTPSGTFFLTELLEPTNAGYGPYAFGVSAFSDVLSDFGGGPGQIGLHGTDDEDSIGTAASHGCIRMTDADITRLAGMLPLGTPITIH